MGSSFIDYRVMRLRGYAGLSEYPIATYVDCKIC